MITDIDMTAASVYVGTYHKYNDGSIFGKWLNLSDYTDKKEFYADCAKLHKDEQDPEFMFQDYENIPESLINESWISDKIFEIIKAIDDMQEDHRLPFFIFCDNYHQDLERRMSIP